MLIEKKEIDSYLGLLPDIVIENALANYGFDETWLVLPFLNMNGQAIAINRRSETAKKALILYKENIYILKEIPWYCSTLSFVEYELSLQDRLCDEGLPVPRIERTLNGNLHITLVYDANEKFFFLQEYKDGASWDGSNKKIRYVAKSLAELHNAGYVLKDEIGGNPPKGTVFGLAQKMIEVGEQVISEKSLRISKDHLLILKDYFNFSKSVVAEHENSALQNGYNDLAFPIHGDFNPWNLIFSKNEEVFGIIDFDNSIIDNPAHDLAEALLDFCFFTFRKQKTRFEHVPREFNLILAREFVETYAANNRKMFSLMKKYLPETVLAVSHELFALGIVRGDFEFSDCIAFSAISLKLPSSIHSLVKNI